MVRTATAHRCLPVPTPARITSSRFTAVFPCRPRITRPLILGCRGVEWCRQWQGSGVQSMHFGHQKSCVGLVPVITEPTVHRVERSARVGGGDRTSSCSSSAASDISDIAFTAFPCRSAFNVYSDINSTTASRSVDATAGTVLAALDSWSLGSLSLLTTSGLRPRPMYRSRE